jgi:hypothetical protein
MVDLMKLISTRQTSEDDHGANIGKGEAAIAVE